jgi:hypothetical protein
MRIFGWLALLAMALLAAGTVLFIALTRRRKLI